jgi:hypothetical protein
VRVGVLRADVLFIFGDSFSLGVVWLAVSTGCHHPTGCRLQVALGFARALGCRLQVALGFARGLGCRLQVALGFARGLGCRLQVAGLLHVPAATWVSGFWAVQSATQEGWVTVHHSVYEGFEVST